MVTLVLEMEVESLDQWQQQRMFRDLQEQAATAIMPDVFESGRTECSTIHDG